MVVSKTTEQSLIKIEKVIKEVLLQSKTHTKVLTGAIMKHYGVHKETVRAAVKLHYLKKIGNKYYEANVANWEPIQFRNILEFTREISRTTSNRYNERLKAKAKTKEVDAEPTSVFMKSLMNLPKAVVTTDEQLIMDAISILRKYEVKGTITITIKL